MSTIKAITGIVSAGLAYSAFNMIFMAKPDFPDPLSMTTETLGIYLVATDPSASAFKAAKRHFPDDFETMVAGLVGVAKAPDTIGLTGERIEQALLLFIRDKADAMVAAPAGALVDVTDAQADLIDQLRQSNVELCARYVAGDMVLPSQLPDAAQDAAVDSMEAMILAAYEGRMKPTSHPTKNYAVVDSYALLQLAREQGISETTLTAIQTGTGTESLSDDAICSAAAAFNRALSDMPEDQAARILAGSLSDAT